MGKVLPEGWIPAWISAVPEAHSWHRNRRAPIKASEARNRLKMAREEALAKRVRAHTEWLEKEIARTDGDLDEAIEKSAALKENEALPRSVPGVGGVLAQTLLAELPELGSPPTSACAP